MKKLITAAVFVFAFALAVTPALAGTTCCKKPQKCPCPDQSNTAVGVSNTVTAGANTGNNMSMGFFSGVATGPAFSTASGVNAINTNVKTGWSTGSQQNGAYGVSNTVASAANTGYNASSGMVITGGAAAGAQGVNLVNTNVKIGGMMW
ncbi:MAG: hypothetical protein WCX17_03480 [Parcubacteria group bacterium]|jgi:hypothetical protein